MVEAGGSRSATILGFSNDFENSKSSIGEKRQTAAVQVQNRYSRSAGVSFLDAILLDERNLVAPWDESASADRSVRAASLLKKAGLARKLTMNLALWDWNLCRDGPSRPHRRSISERPAVVPECASHSRLLTGSPTCRPAPRRDAEALQLGDQRRSG